MAQSLTNIDGFFGTRLNPKRVVQYNKEVIEHNMKLYDWIQNMGKINLNTIRKISVFNAQNTTTDPNKV